MGGTDYYPNLQCSSHKTAYATFTGFNMLYRTNFKNIFLMISYFLYVLN